ncbi:hypothetical protein PybrP1_003080 [[Pythium] brassicae (nom. inval.)]|nr:hypothetical protein PybrP1_003080 [[Pythium] brassicae (nom. inval.)]
MQLQHANPYYDDSYAVFYPDAYNGCWSFCPDASDFRKFQLVDVLHDAKAYETRGTGPPSHAARRATTSAVYSPLDALDSHPAEIWDKLTGEINRETAAYWEAHFDDSYYLNDAVYLLEDFLEQTQQPYYNGSIEYGVRDSKGYKHCWAGSFDQYAAERIGLMLIVRLARAVDGSGAAAPASGPSGSFVVSQWEKRLNAREKSYVQEVHESARDTEA